EQQVQEVNITGLRHLLDFTADAGAELVHISTAYVVRHGDESVSDCPQRHYTASKVDGEAMVVDSGVPAAIVRPSIVVGDRETGVTPQYQALHHLVNA